MTRPGHSQLKSLQVRRQELMDQLSSIDNQSKEIKNQRKDVENKIKEVDSSISKLTKKEIQVTEHALLQFIQRVYGMDLEKIKKEILTESVVSTIDQLGSATIPVQRQLPPDDLTSIENFRVVAKNRVVVTVKI